MPFLIVVSTVPFITLRMLASRLAVPVPMASGFGVAVGCAVVPGLGVAVTLGVAVGAAILSFVSTT